MKLVLINFQYCLLFLYLMFSFSCIGQLSEKKSSPLKEAVTEKLQEGEASMYQPIVDSVLQFNVMVTDIFEDSKGNFWFGSHGDGLCRYDGKQYTYFKVNHGLPSGVFREFAPGPDWSKVMKINGGNQISSIQEDKDGIIWIKTSDKICKFNGQVFTAVQTDKQSILSMDKSAEEWKKELDYLWFGSWKELGVYRYDGNKLEFINFPYPYNAKTSDGVSELYKDNEGNIWFGTMENGTFRYDGKSFTRINKDDEIGVCRSVFQEKNGRVWVTNNRYGVCYVDGGSLINFEEEYNLKNKDKLNSIETMSGCQSIEQDENGDLWFGTFGDGLWRYDGEQLYHFNKENSFPIVTSKTIYKDRRGKLWYGIGEGTVYGFDGKSFERFDER